MRWAERFKANEPVLLITDSLNVYNYLTGQSTCQTPHLKPLVNEAKTLFAERSVHHVTFGHMLRMHHNYADAVVNRAISTATGIGDATLFPDVPVKTQNTSSTPTPFVVTPEVSLDITTLKDFVGLRRFKSRSTISAQLCPYWGMLVKLQLRELLLAETIEKRDAGIIRLFALPTLFLPSNASNTRIAQHMTSGKPFNINTNKPHQGQPKPAAERLAEAVRRLAMDRKLRTANKLLQNCADEMAFDEKVKALQNKLVPKEGADDDDDSNATFPVATTPAFSAIEVESAIRNVNRQSATSIDGWSRDLLVEAATHVPSIYEDVAVMLTIIVSQPLTPLLSDVLRVARLVAIPKEPTGVRPIAIANLWLKIIGIITVNRDKTLPAPQQFALRCKNGCEQVIHRVKRAMTEGKVIIKFDIANAFNSVKRKQLAKILEGHPPLTQQFWRLAYGESSPLCVFGPDSTVILDMQEGIRQGDSTSTFLFCLAVNGVLSTLAEKMECWMYCDDLTVAVDRELVTSTVCIVETAFKTIGLSVNAAKTKVLDTGDAFAPREPFVLLGCDLAETPEYCETQIHKQAKYFRLLDSTPIHPQLKMVFLRICGTSRIKYVASVMNTSSINKLLRFFDDRALESFYTILGAEESDVPRESIHDSLGAGIPNYTDLAPKLLCASEDFALRGVKQTVELVTRASSTAQPMLKHNLDAHWLWFSNTLTPAEFITAFSVRMGFIPKHLRLWPAKCDCGHTIVDDASQIRHTFTCDQFTKYTHTTRHNLVRDAICRTTNAYGISCTKEPTIYTYAAGRKRPDILFHLARPAVTDVTVVYPKDQPGQAATKADDEKSKQHREAANSLSHIFVPCALEAMGTFGKNTTTLITTISQDLPPAQKKNFRFDMYREISTAMAKGRASAVFGSRWRSDTHNT